MHHHRDHLGGIWTAIDEGATILAHASNQVFFERLATAPHTINPDLLLPSKKAVKLQTVDTESTLTDGTRTIKLYAMTGFDHVSGLLLVYLPKEKILAESDAYTPSETPDTPSSRPRFRMQPLSMTTFNG